MKIPLLLLGLFLCICFNVPTVSSHSFSGVLKQQNNDKKSPHIYIFLSTIDPG